MIEFDENGFLKPYDIIETDLATIEKIFVEGVPLSSTRKAIFESYLSYNEELRKIIPTGFTQWIDGSFVTKKRNPKDIDLVTFIDFEQYNSKEREIDKLRAERSKRGSLVDGYFVAIYPKEHILGNIYEIERKKWLFQFSTDKRTKNKGILQINS